MLLWRGLTDRSYWQGLGQRLGFGASLRTPGLWLHAVSLGEMSAAAPLLRALRRRYPQLPLVVTTATPAGRARAEALLPKDADIRFLPYDTPGSVRRFLARTQPRVAIIMETELWPNLLRECERRGVPVLLASARLSDKSVSRYQHFGALFGGVFTQNLVVAAQTNGDAERFRAIGAPAGQIHVTGNVKFDLELAAGSIQAGHELRAAFGAHRPVWIAGSTHAGEEEQVLDAHALVQAAVPEALLILVPRHRDRFAAVADLLSRRGVEFARRSLMPGAVAAPVPDAQPIPAPVLNTPPISAPALLADTVGELALLYACADVAFVGGSLVPIGGHNLLEPAALGLPVLTGPSYRNSEEIAQLLLARGAAIQVNSARDLALSLQRLLADPVERRRIGGIGQEIVAANRGSVERLMVLIEPWLPAAHPSPAAAQAYPSAGH
jgi:3-deoxy-D-manno-octulosonic-acid transferase